MRFHQREHDEGDENKVQDDTGKGRRKGPGKEHFQCEDLGVHGRHEKARQTPYAASDQHAEDKRGIEEGELFREQFKEQSAEKAVGGKFEGHGKTGRVNGRHAEDGKAQKRGDKADQGAVGHPA